MSYLTRYPYSATIETDCCSDGGRYWTYVELLSCFYDALIIDLTQFYLPLPPSYSYRSRPLLQQKSVFVNISVVCCCRCCDNMISHNDSVHFCCRNRALLQQRSVSFVNFLEWVADVISHTISLLCFVRNRLLLRRRYVNFLAVSVMLWSYISLNSASIFFIQKPTAAPTKVCLCEHILCLLLPMLWQHDLTQWFRTLLLQKPSLAPTKVCLVCELPRMSRWCHVSHDILTLLR